MYPPPRDATRHCRLAYIISGTHLLTYEDISYISASLTYCSLEEFIRLDIDPTCTVTLGSGGMCECMLVDTRQTTKFVLKIAYRKRLRSVTDRGFWNITFLLCFMRRSEGQINCPPLLVCWHILAGSISTTFLQTEIFQGVVFAMTDIAIRFV